MKHLKTYELFLGGKIETLSGFENYLMDHILMNGILYKKDEFETVHFEIPNFGKITFGNFEWLGDVESFKQNAKLQDKPYTFFPKLNFDSVKVEKTFSEKLTDVILKTIK